MREHGVLKRSCSSTEKRCGGSTPAKSWPPEACADSGRIIRSFIEDYHEKLEEDFLFPRFQKANKLVDLVEVLLRAAPGGTEADGHDAASRDRFQPSEIRRDRNSWRTPSGNFVRMYRPHEAREDTVLFPAFRGIVVAKSTMPSARSSRRRSTSSSARTGSRRWSTGWPVSRRRLESTTWRSSRRRSDRRCEWTPAREAACPNLGAAAAILIRVLVGWVFVSEGVQKFLFPDALGAGRFAKIGIPSPQLTAPFVGAVEIVCGLLLLLGLLTRLATIPLLIDMAVAILSTKLPMLSAQGFGPFSLPKLPRYGFWSMAHEARVDFSMWLGSLFLIITGAGGLSLDALLARRSRLS